ncbi:AIG2-like family-domain-containing protein [Sordaria brevicollis]|uniref:Putative gamma-glutamylcyclotransferase n=1 Tax=Sordaria brevicollis TaxID=83679 RepID=A0AAE0PNN5_SORBR|nr:AIG2-like family-domain-containing protein [Sordaria brevicollis]
MANSEQPSAQSDDPMHRAFFYGTLMVPEVFYTVCYNSKTVPDVIARQHVFTPAILHGYCRHRVKQADYPGITEDTEHSVFGMLAEGLTKANLDKLDYFEGAEYERRTVKVNVLDKVGDVTGEGNVEGEEKEVQVYVFLPTQHLEEKEWDLEEFKREKLRLWTRGDHIFAGKCSSQPIQGRRLGCPNRVGFFMELECEQYLIDPCTFYQPTDCDPDKPATVAAAV